MTADAHPRPVVLALNAGSGTIAATAYRLDPEVPDASPLTSVWQLDVVRHTDPQQITVTTDDAEMSTTAPADDLDAAVLPGLDALIESVGSDAVIAVGHRIVHGGDLDEPVLIDEAVATTIRDLGALAPLHNDVGLETFELAREVFPRACHVAVFDSMFHVDIPIENAAYGGPRSWIERGLHRVGFHGISHHDAARRTASAMSRPLEDLELITVHLGGGCSATAIRHGRSVDTTMGLTPTDGMVMAARSGSVDPGLIIHLLRHDGLDVDELEDLLNHRSGLMGLTENRTGDIAEVHRRGEQHDAIARVAEDVYVRSIAREVAGLRASLDGLDAFVLTGSAVENEPWLWRRIATRLRHLGVTVDHAVDDSIVNAGLVEVSGSDATVRVFVVVADENRAIAQHAFATARRS